ncbi:MAG TPA: alkaline phosphatase family protein, partial [Gemmatimonadaceae bacterium]
MSTHTAVRTRIGYSAIALLVAPAIAACADRGSAVPITPTSSISASSNGNGGEDQGAGPGRIQHVLLISVDGLHQSDLERFVASHPASAFAALAKRGVTFTNARTSKPSDSFPGLLAQVTGGSPKSTGVYYDNSYDRELYAPRSGCTGSKGTEVVYDESIDRNSGALDAGGGIDPAALPLRKTSTGCTPVYPHQYLRANTIFEVAKGAGLRTAWSDKHPAYDIVNGPSGHGVDDLFTPEIASGPYEDGVTHAMMYDAIKVDAIVHEIQGTRHDGTGQPGVPAIFGMNFQAVSVGEKTAGYVDAAGTPSADLETALEFADRSVGRMVAELETQHLTQTTMVIVSAKHGQAPIDPSRRRIIDAALMPNTINGVKSGLIAKATEDDIALVWLTDRSRTADAANALTNNAGPLGVASVLYGAPLAAMFANPATDSRAPDLIAVVQLGVIYAGPAATKRAEHGGFSDDDGHVPILVAGPGTQRARIDSPVTTRQIAPTILSALGLNPASLDAVRQEGTTRLPIA